MTLYRVKLEKEMNGLCNEIVSVIDSKLIMLAGDPESRVFYWKMKGDYYRYQAEYQLSGDNKEHYTLEAAEKGFEAYETASFIALSDLPPTHPVRLGLALNFSVFFKEIMKAPDRALTLARTAYQDGFSEISRSDSSPKEETRTIMKLLSENITLWSKETETQNPYF